MKEGWKDEEEYRMDRAKKRKTVEKRNELKAIKK